RHAAARGHRRHDAQALPGHELHRAVDHRQPPVAGQPARRARALPEAAPRRRAPAADRAGYRGGGGRRPMVTPARCRRLLALLLATLLGLGRIATAEAAADAEEATLEVVLEPLGEAPFEQEMVLLTIHGSYRGTITRERLEQPSSPDFGWMQLGTNQWSDESARGRQARRFERRIAIFPQRSGRLEVPSFVHHLTLLDDQGRRREIAVRSAPVSFAVRPRPAGVDWWLPA